MNSSCIKAKGTLLPSRQSIKTDIAKSTKKSNFRRKKEISLRLGILIWLIICIPSNILVGVFYFKQSNSFSKNSDNSTAGIANTNETFILNETEDDAILQNISKPMDEVRCKSLRCFSNKTPLPYSFA